MQELGLTLDLCNQNLYLLEVPKGCSSTKTLNMSLNITATVIVEAILSNEK